MRALRVSICALMVLVANTAASAQDNAPAPGTPTYAKEVSRIMQTKCADCHHPSGIGPFSLLTYRQTKGWAEMIKEVVSDRRMPPWHAASEHGHFANNLSLSSDDIATIVDWTKGNRVAGDPADAPPPANHIVYAAGEWSRPRLSPVLVPSIVGVRPNSPPQTTSVVSNRPRCLRSRNRPAIGLSVCDPPSRWLDFRLLCASQPPLRS